VPTGKALGVALVILVAAGVTIQSRPQATGAIPASRARTAQVSSPVGSTTACSTAVATAPMLVSVQTHFATGLLEPFGVAFAPDSEHVFVDSLILPSSPSDSLAPGRSASGITVYSISPSGLVADRVGSFPTASLVGMATSPDGRELVAAGGSGARIFSTSRMEQANSAPSSWLLGSFASTGQGAIEATFSPDGHYVFVTLEDSDQIAVFNFQKAERHGFGPSDLVGYVPLGMAPVGMALSPNGRYLYATSEAVTTGGGEGTLSTIDLRHAEVDPAHSVISTVWAGCSPVRVVASGSSVYVTARGSDDLVEFSARNLVSDPGSAMVGHVEVGESPVGLALVDHDKSLVIADSNRFQIGNAVSNLAVVATSENGPLTLLGYVAAGGFPRDMTVSPDGKTLIVSDFDSGDVEEVGLTTLPR